MSRKITNPIPDINFEEYKKYYEEHTREETCSYFNITVTQHKKLCKLNNYKKPLNLVNIDRGHKRSQKLKELWADKSSIYNSKDFLSRRAETLKNTWETADKSKWSKAISDGINNMSEESKEHKSKLLSAIHADKDGYFQSSEYKDLLSKKQSEAWKSESTRNKHNESYEKAAETMYNTKKKNGTFNTSKPEIELYEFLQHMYHNSVIIKGYRDGVRYPFNCDFYIKSIDEFIELNAHWTHGPHPFDPSNEDDIKLLNKWRSKQRLTKDGKKNSYYKAEEVWTVRDPNKLAIAKQNNLNYVMIYREGAFFI